MQFTVAREPLVLGFMDLATRIQSTLTAYGLTPEKGITWP